MSSQLDVRLGVAEPTILHLPPGVASLAAAEEAIELADSYGVADGFPLAESQRITLRGALGERADGSWAATRVADFGPRQGTGKNDKIAARELAGLVLFGERLIIHTAHEFPTANEAFLRLVAIFENWDDLRRRVARIRYANGEQGIEFLSGQRLKYRARTGGSGRGFAKADLVVYDEAQHLSREHVSASGPAKLANPNSQTWYAGSGGLESSAVAWAIRRAAILGQGGRLAYTEATAESVTIGADGKISSMRPDPADLDMWYRAMPGLGRWVTEESMRALFEELGPDLFARECLCVWDAEAGADRERVISADQWSACEDRGSRRQGRVVFSVDVSTDHAWSAVGVAGSRSDGLPHVEVVAHRPGTEWVPGVLAALKAKHNPAGFVIDAKGPAKALVPDIAAAGIPVVKVDDRRCGLVLVSGPEHAQACGMLFEGAVGGWLRHTGQANVAAALDGATKRPLGDAWAWNRSASSVDITPLVAVTLALWGFNTILPPVESGLVLLDDFLED